MGWADELDTEGKERGNCCGWDCRLLLDLVKFSFSFISFGLEKE